MTRGEIYVMDFGIPVGSEPGYRRPVVVVQSNKQNLENLNTTIVVPLTTNLTYSEYDGNVFIAKEDSKLPKDSVALVHQIIVVDKRRLQEQLSKLDIQIIKKIEDAEDYVLK